MASRKPLLDTEWLLGSPDNRGPWRRRFLYHSGIVLFLVALSVGLWPTLSKSWVQTQLTQQYHNGPSADSRNEAMIALAEMLPESLPVVIAGLSKPVPEEAHLAFEALDYYVGQLTTLPVEQRRGSLAELIHALEVVTPSLSYDSAHFTTALAARVTAVQQSDQHPGALLTLAACKRILENRHSSNPATTATYAKLSDTSDSAPRDQPHTSVIASLSDIFPDQAPERQPSTIEEVSTVDNATTPVRMSLKSNDDVDIEPLPFESTSTSNATANAGQLKQKLLRANRFIPVAGTLNVPIQSNAVPIVSSKEEVVGIARWKSEDLLTLLSSVTPRLASAAFHELQSRLSPKELDLAVELAQGTPERRIQAMEGLVRDSHVNPIPWLAWMGSEADRDVRFKAVSLLGSINNDDARLRLRMMHSRERDVEISRHIQCALLASGSAKPHIR